MGRSKIDHVAAMSLTPAAITTTDAAEDATDFLVDMRGMLDKAVLVKNTGANSLTYSIFGSLNDGASYDIAVKAETAVGAAAQNLYRDSDYYTHWKIRVRSTGGGSPGTAEYQIAARS